MLRGFRDFLGLALLFFSLAGSGQELYPLNEPASTVPKNVVGIRVKIGRAHV